jgi:hypothetical protein
MSTFLKETSLKMSEFLKNKYFFNEISFATYFLKMTTFSKANVLVLPELLKNKNFINGKSASFARILENQKFFQVAQHILFFGDELETLNFNRILKTIIFFSSICFLFNIQ